MPNRLAAESSPYLLQHANQPVDWYPWGDEAFARAKLEAKPILLSVGYSACHWCHVMAHESFEDSTLADYLNEHFVSIKVDREERPDIDSIYMDAVVAISGRGGWPMTVFLAPDGRPFYGGTYYPPTDRYGMPGFGRVLASVVDAYHNRSGDIARATEQLTGHIQRAAHVPPAVGPVDPGTLDAALESLGAGFDPTNGGFGAAPKFPQAGVLEFALRMVARTGSPVAASALRTTLARMAAGGIHDQLGGGFHRYSVDAEWLVPHFEKMLYDNALLSRIYLLAYQATGVEEYRDVATRAIDYVLRDLASPAGGFCAAEDADSEGEEGRYYVWSLDEVLAICGEDIGPVAARHFGVTAAGNFEGANILHVASPVGQLARDLGETPDSVAATVEQARARLLTARARRVRPARDTKVLADWNGLMLRSLADAARILRRDDYLEAALTTGYIIERELIDGGRVFHRPARVGVPRYGFLDDQAACAWGFLGLYEATLDPRWLRRTADLAETMLRHFWVDAETRFYDTSDNHEPLIARPHGLSDNATPAGAGLACAVLVHLSRLLGRPQYADIARRVLTSNEDAAVRYPTAFASTLLAMDLLATDCDEVVLVGRPDDPRTAALAAEAGAAYRPYQLVVRYDPDSPDNHISPLVTGRTQVAGQPTAYVCRGTTCGLPATDPEALRRQLTAPSLQPG